MAQEQLLNVIQSLASNKKRERSASLDKIQDLLKQDNIIKYLQCKSDSSLTWNTLFICVHNAILMDVDNACSRNITLSSKLLQTIENIIREICQKTIQRDISFLSCDVVVSNIISVFETNFRKTCLGSVYTDVLTRHILNHRKFWGEIKLEQWIGMKDFCITCFKNPPPNTQSVVYLDALSDIIRLSCKNILISQNFLDVFGFIYSIFTSYKNSLSAFVVPLLRLINILCLQLAVEFRYKVCSFMEEIFEFVISFYEKKENSRNPLIYHFFTIYLSVHNPNGVARSDDLFYAQDEERWKKQVIQISSLIQEAVKNLLRNSEKTELDLGFMDLVVEISHLALTCGFDRLRNYDSNCDNYDYADIPISNKRKRSNGSSPASPLSANLARGLAKQIKRNGNFFYIFYEFQTPDAWFWLCFLESFLAKYPQILATELNQVLKVLRKLLCDYRDSATTQDVCRCLKVVVSEGAHFEDQMSETEKKEVNDEWDKVGDELMRLLNVEDAPEYHSLLRSLIENFKFQKIMTLLNLYYKGVIPNNLESFMTVVTLCKNFVLLESVNESGNGDQEQIGCDVRLYFLKWLFAMRIKYPVQELSETLFLLTVTKPEKICGFAEPKVVESLLISRKINDFCKLITRVYENVSLENLKLVKNVNCVESSITPKIETKILSELFSSLDRRLLELTNDMLKDDNDVPFNLKLEIIQDSLHHSELLLNLYSRIINHVVEIPNWSNKLDEFKSFFFLISTKSLQLIQKQYFSLGGYINLYSMKYHVNLSKIIREKDCMYLMFLQFLFKIFEDQLNENFGDFKGKKDERMMENVSDEMFIPSFSNLIGNPKSILHIKSSIAEERNVIEVVEFLCNFIIIHDSLEKNQFQKTLEMKLFECLMKEGSLNFNSNFHIKIVFSVIYNYSKCRLIDFNILNKNLRLLSMIFNAKKLDSELVLVIVEIMKEFTYLVNVTDDRECDATFLELIHEFRSMIFDNKKYGINVLLKFIDLLTVILETDWNESSIFHKTKKEVKKLSMDIISFLKHPYYEVRLFVAQKIGSVFKMSKIHEAVIDLQQTLIVNLKDTLREGNCLTEENIVTKMVRPYHRDIHVSASLISWASIICISRFWRRSALFNLFQVAFIEKFKQDRVFKTINLICNMLNIRNPEEFIEWHLPYLLKKWAENEYDLEDFPYQFLRCQSTEEFTKKYLDIIVPLCVWNRHMNILEKTSCYVNKPIKQILQELFPDLMAIILPCLSENVVSDNLLKARKLKQFIDSKLDNPSFNLIRKHLDQIIFRMFSYIEDKNYFLELCNTDEIIFEECSYVFFTVSQVEEALENMSEAKGRPLLREIALHRPSIIQRVLIRLVGAIDQAFIRDDKIISFYKYVAFIDILTKTTRHSIFRNFMTFIIRDVIYTMVAFIRSYNDFDITNMALKCLRKLLRNSIVDFGDVVNEFLAALTILCKPLAQQGNREALELLNYMICDNFKKLRPSISTLDQFPTESIFKEINVKLEESKFHGWTSTESTIKHFLDMSNRGRCSVEGLKGLRNVLTNRKEDLKRMYADFNTLRGFSEDCKKSLLHQMLYGLIELTRDKDILIRTEAAKCLGELGPSDLKTLVLRPENHYVKEKMYEPPLQRLLNTCINDLTDLIINVNFTIKMAASELIYVILSTRDGNELIKRKDEKIRSYLLPFHSTLEENLILKILVDDLDVDLNHQNLWNIENHESWIISLVKQLLKSFKDTCGFIPTLVKMVDLNWHIAERIFPIVLDMILSEGGSEGKASINKFFGAFFEKYLDKKSSTPIDLKSVQCMVNVVDYIRIQRNYEGNYEKSNIRINFLHVAKAAHSCSAFFTSILYVELWFNDKKRKKPNLTIDEICESYAEEGAMVTEILRDCYAKIGIFDGVHGCGYMHLLDCSTESQHYEHLNKWTISMLYHDISLSQGSSSETRLMTSFLQSGMFYSLKKLIESSDNKEELQDIQYQCASFLCDWNLFHNRKLKGSYQKSRYFALKSFHDDDEASFFKEICNARSCTINKLASCNLESVENLYQYLSELRCLKELEDFAAAVKVPTENELKELYQRWCKQDSIKYSNFKLIEDILTQRIIVIKEEVRRNKNQNVRNYLYMMVSEIYYKLIKAARKEKRYEAAIRNLNHLSRIENIPESISGKMKIEKSLLEWEMGEVDIGKFLLSHYLKKNEIRGNLKSKALRMYGDWMSSTNSGNWRNIIDEYYTKSIIESKSLKDRVSSYASLAKFADSIYEQVKDYLSSPLFEIKKNITTRQQDMASELRQVIGWISDREKKIACRLMEKQSVIDENEIKSSEDEKDLFLKLAVKYYLLTLKEGEKYDFMVFRLISLWFSNLNQENIIIQLKNFLHQIPTYKFLCILPQIVPRMADVGLTSSIIERALNEHPHHTLPLLFALANSYKDAKYNGVKSMSSSQRELVASAMLEKFQKDNQLMPFITEMSEFCDAMIELANASPGEGKTFKAGTVISISKLKISRLNNLSHVAVPSLNIPVRKSCNYENVICLKSIESQYQLVGGINIPKKIKCIGLDGVSRSLLVKGRDDLRQDAVMQQVFTIMNSLLSQNPETCKRKLVIRTYKVVPLSHRSGIIEWCENTQPLSLYLIGPDGISGAHRKFNPDDITALECRSILRKTAERPDVTNDKKLKAFLDICEVFHPAFRNFFFENFPEPGVWFERRLAYTQSVATSSMIGYILGIGDRHVHNILIDNATAEVIHIDLGIAFEQGKTLPTPETVPFRLTRDIVDGMGISDVEGVFRLSCIKTMEVLRENQRNILTLLEVLLYDPLYAWTITNEKAFNVQGQEGTDSSSGMNSSVIEINKMAERALIRLKQKLQGIETGGVAMNAEGQVNSLIQQARDPNNLCRLFHGWQAYL